MVRFVPRRQPVERSCCMSPPTTVLIRRMEPATRPTSGSVSPARAITVTPTTNAEEIGDRKSTRLNSSHSQISYAVFCLKKKKQQHLARTMSSLLCIPLGNVLVDLRKDQHH